MGWYQYDASFVGYLSAVVSATNRGDTAPRLITDQQSPQGELFAETPLPVASDQDQARHFRQTFVTRVSPEAFATLRYAFHSSTPDKEQLLWEYIRLGMTVGVAMTARLADEPVCTVNRIARHVAHEAHKYKGFVRFREVMAGDGEQTFLYAAIEPEAEVLPLIAPHFRERISDRPWMIHDLGRGQAVLGNGGRWQLVNEVTAIAEPTVTAAEQQFTALWQGYFATMVIPERHNPRLQQQHVPLRYRKHLPEFT